MKSSVKNAFVPFTDRFEGSVPFFYVDKKQLVTIARGNLVDPIGSALGLPMYRKDGFKALRDEIAADWHNVKNRAASLAEGGWKLARQFVTLHLTPDGENEVTFRKLAQVEADMRRRFPFWESLCADAQLGVLSMAWAVGDAFHFPHFEAALAAGDFATCAKECHIDDHELHGTLTLRNVANELLFENAQHVADTDADPTVLYYAV